MDLSEKMEKIDDLLCLSQSSDAFNYWKILSPYFTYQDPFL